MIGIDIFFIDGTEISVDSINDANLVITDTYLSVFSIYEYRYELSTIAKYEIYPVCICGYKLIENRCQRLDTIYYDDNIYLDFVNDMEKVRITANLDYYQTWMPNVVEIVYDTIGMNLRDYIIIDKLIKNPNYVLPRDICKIFEHYPIKAQYYYIDDSNFNNYRIYYERKLKLDFIKNL